MNSVKIENVNIKWLGHSGFLLEGDGKKVYIDPFEISEEPAFDDKADILMITHEHFDHCSPEDIRKVRRSDSTTLIKTVLLNSGEMRDELLRGIIWLMGLKSKEQGLR